MGGGGVVVSVVSSVGEVFETEHCKQCGCIPENASSLLAHVDRMGIGLSQDVDELWMLRAVVCCW